MSSYAPPNNILPIFNSNQYNNSSSSSSVDNTELLTDIDTNISSLLVSNAPALCGVGYKTTKTSGTTGIEFDGKKYRAVENLGYTTTIFLNSLKTIVPLLGAGEFVFLPTTATALKMSSSSTADTSIQMFVLGYDASWNQVFDVFVLNGQTPVLGVYGTLFFRVIGSQCISSSNVNPGTITAGNLYLVSSSYSSFTAGVPNALTQCLATGLAGTGNLYTGTVSIPPNTDLYASQLVLSSNASGNSSDLAVSFWSRMGTTSGWRKLAELNVNSTLPAISLEQSGFPSLNTDFSGTQYHDLMLCVTRTSGNSNAISLSSYLSLQEVKNS